MKVLFLTLRLSLLVGSVYLLQTSATAQKQKSPQFDFGVAPLGVDTGAPDFCSPPKKKLAGRAKIILTASSFAHILGGVAPRSAWTNSQPEVDDATSEQNDDDVDPALPNAPTGISTKAKTDPFHVYLRASDFPAYADGNHPYLLVRVVIPSFSGLTFYHINDPHNWIQGIGKTQDTPDKAICYPAPPNPIPSNGAIIIRNQGRQVVRFYIDLTKVFATTTSNPVPLNILVVPNNAPETTIIIDPKIYNDG